MPVEGQTATTRRGETYAGRSREQRASERRARIVASSVHLFGTRDYDDVTVADICAGARVSKRYFYEHFDDRADLLLKVNREQNEWLLRNVAAAIPERPRDLAELFRPALRTLVEMLRTHPESARVIYVNAPRMEDRRRGVLREDAQFVAAVLRRAIGKPQDQVGYDRTLLALVAGLSEVIIDWISHDMTGDPDELAEHLTAIALALTGSVKPEPTSDVKPEPTSNVKPGPTSNVKPEPTSNAKPGPTSNVKPEPTSNAKPEANGNVKPETR